MRTRFLPLCICMCLFANLQAQLAVDLVEVASGFTAPVDIAHAGDDRLFIVDRQGTITIIDGNGATLPTPFLDIDPIVRNNSSQSEQGLLGLVFHPDYATNGYFYVHYIDNANDSQIARYSVDPSNPNLADPSSRFSILSIEQPFSNHNGGDLAFGPNGYLFIGMGDGGSGGDPNNAGQTRNTLLGKMLRIDVNGAQPYSIPADNPFINDPNTSDEIWSLGLRNPWRFSFDRETNDLWIADVGQNAREEINLEKANSTGGLNYGWRCFEGNQTFNQTGCIDASNFTLPLYDYDHMGRIHCSITGGFVYRGSTFPSLIGHYIYADYCSGQMWTLSPDGNGGYQNESIGIFSNTGFTTFGEDQDGEVYVASLFTGKIYRLENQNCANLTVDFTKTDESCRGDADGAIDLMVYSPELPLVYQWNTGATTEDLNNLIGGTYFFTVTDNIGCMFTGNIFISNQTADIIGITAGGPTTFCEGESVVLTASDVPAGYTYVWLNGTDTIPGENGQTLNVISPGTYIMTLKDGPCPVTGNSNSIGVTVNEKPDASMISASGSTSLCAGEQVSLTSASAPANYTYQWYKDNVLINGANNQTLVVDNGGSYYVIFDGECPTDQSNWITVTVADEISTVFQDTPGICEGDALDSPAYLQGLFPALDATVTSFHDASPPSASNEITYPYTLNNDLTVYVVSTISSCADTASFVLTAFDLPTVPAITFAGGVLAAPGNYDSYQWLLNSQAINGATSASYTPNQDGDYSVSVGNDRSCMVESNVLSVIITNVEEYLFDQYFDVSPNPTLGLTRLNYHGNQDLEFELQIYDVGGKQWLSEKHLASEGWNQVLNFKDRPAGIYLLQIKSQAGIGIKKIVKE